MEDAAGIAVQLGSRVLEAHMHDSAAVVDKGHTRLASAVVTGKAGVACQLAATHCNRQPPQVSNHPWSWLQWWCVLIGQNAPHATEVIICYT
jgi:hypothetical protein